MARVKAAAIEMGNATATSFDAAQRKWNQSLASTDPIYKAMLAQQQALTRQQGIGDNAVRLGIATQAQAGAQLDAVRAKYQQNVDAAGNAATAQTLFGKATSGVSAQLVAMAAGAGPVGVFLSALGPWGIAAAVGLGVASTAFGYVKDESARMGQAAIALQQFKDVTGLTVGEIGALRDIGSSLGIEGDKITSSFERLTSGLADAHRASGTLYTDVRQVSGSLADQLQQSTSTADAINILARAYQGAGDASAKAAIARAAFGGRGGAALGPVLGQVADSGSVQDLAAKMSALQAQTDAETKRWAEMQAQIDETRKRSANILASIITDQGLQAQKTAADEMERMARAAKAMFDQGARSSEFAQQMQGLTMTQRRRISRAGQSAADAGASPDDVARQTAAMAAQMKASPDTMKLAQTLDDVTTAANKMAASTDDVTTSLQHMRDNAAAAATKANELGSFLGSATTIDEKLAARLAQINSLYADSKTGLTDAAQAQDAFNRATDAANLDAQVAKTQALLAAQGASAPVSLQVLAVTQRLNAEQRKDPQITDAMIKSAGDLARARILGTMALQQQIDTTNTEIATMGMSVGAATAYRAVQDRVAQASRDGQALTAAEIAQYTTYATTLGNVKQAQAELDAQRKASFDLQTVFFDDTEKAIAQLQQQLHGDAWPSFMNDGLAATMRLAGALKDVRTYANDFGQTLIQNLAQGKSLTDSLSASINNLGSQIAAKAMTSGVNGLFGGATGTGGAGSLDISSMLNQFKTMASSLTSAISSSLNSAMSTAASSISQSTASAGESPASSVTGGGGSFGAIGNIAVAIGISELQGQAAKLKQAQADFEAAQKAWSDMAADVTKFTDQMNGTTGGTFTTSLADATQQAQKFADAAHAAGQNADAVQAALTAGVDKLARDFIGSFDVMTEALDQGLGADSPAVKAQQNVAQLGDTLKAFIVDTENVVTLTGANASAVGVAAAASQQYALSLLQTVPPLTDVQTKLLTLRGTAQQLQTTLQDLGMSSDAAAAAIASGIGSAIDQITSDFRSGIQAKINSANGQGYLNDIGNLITESLGDLSDAQSLGTDPTVVAQYFQAQAQSIVDGAGLVGDGFSDLIKQFPSLAGVVHQSSTALDSLTSSVSNFLTSLALGNLSDLSPQQKLQTAQASYQGALTAAQGGDQTALGSITDSAQAFLTAAQDYFASSPDYGAIYAQVTSDLGHLPGIVAAMGTTNQLLGSVASTSGSATDQLAAANDNLSSVGQSTDATASATDSAAQTLTVLQGLQDVTKSASVDISASVAQLGAQSDAIATTQSSQYFGPMVTYLSQIAANTLLQGTPAPPPQSTFEWWNPFTWFADGGQVTGGTPGQDSVMGMLMPGEFVMNARIAQMYLPMLEAMNSGKVPHFAAGGLVGSVPTFTPTIVVSPFSGLGVLGGASSSASNDNGRANFADLARSVASGHQAIIAALREELEGLRAEVRSLNDTTRISASRPARPGGKPASQKAA